MAHQCQINRTDILLQSVAVHWRCVAFFSKRDCVTPAADRCWTLGCEALFLLSADTLSSDYLCRLHPCVWFYLLTLKLALLLTVTEVIGSGVAPYLSFILRTHRAVKMNKWSSRDIFANMSSAHVSCN